MDIVGIGFKVGLGIGAGVLPLLEPGHSKAESDAWTQLLSGHTPTIARHNIRYQVQHLHFTGGSLHRVMVRLYHFLSSLLPQTAFYPPTFSFVKWLANG